MRPISVQTPGVVDVEYVGAEFNQSGSFRLYSMAVITLVLLTSTLLSYTRTLQKSWVGTMGFNV